MSILIYLDTNIYLDFLLDRKGKDGKPFGEITEKVFDRVIACEFVIVWSDWIIYELDRTIGLEKLTMMYEILKAKNKIVRIKYNQEDVENAKRKSAHFQDALHGVLAKRAGAKILVTRNITDFIIPALRIKVKRPEDL